MDSVARVLRARSLSCILCGDSFSVDLSALGAKLPQPSDERPKWKASLDEEGHVRESAADLATIYFKLPWHWRCFGRAIVERREGNCQVTGVGAIGPYFLLPSDPTEFAIRGGQVSCKKKTRKRLDNMFSVDVGEQYSNEKSKGVTHLMHDRCWILLTRTIDEAVCHRNLPKLLAAIHKAGGWVFENKEIVNNLYNDESAWLIQESDTERWKDQSHEDRIADYSRNWKCNKKKFALRDPLRVSDIWASIEAEKGRFHQQRGAGRAIHKHQNPQLRRSKSVNLPPEVIMCILDQFEKSKQVRQLTWAFPNWAIQIPSSYWRLRFIRQLMLQDELDRVPGPEELDWRLLYYKSDRIQGESHGLRNRKRIVVILENVKADFEASLVDKNKKQS